MIEVKLEVLSRDEWKIFSAEAHRAVFDELRPASADRIDFALLGVSAHGLPLGYCTVRELDDRTCYWQYGGAVDAVKGNGVLVSRVYERFLDWARERFDAVTTLVAADNVRYLRLAMAHGFRIIGCRTWDGEVIVELCRRFK